MEKINFWQMVELMRKHNEKYGIHHGDKETPEKPSLYAIIVYKQSNFEKEYSLEARSYKVNSSFGKIFDTNCHFSGSYWGSALDDTDNNVKLSGYDWDIDYCYMVE